MPIANEYTLSYKVAFAAYRVFCRTNQAGSVSKGPQRRERRGITTHCRDCEF